MTIFNKYKERFQSRQPEELSLEDYLKLCRTDHMAYATAQERMLQAIGEPTTLDTRKDDRLGRIFSNRKIRYYPSFAEFYGMEDTIDRIVAFFKHAAQGLEESKQVLYLLGPVGGGKSSLAEQVKKVYERVPFYALKFDDEISPVYESPLSLFGENDAEDLAENYGIPSRYLNWVMSPWASKRVEMVDGDLSRFSVVKLWPSLLNQVGITKVEPGDDNNQDISTLVGKVNIRMLEDYEQNDPDAYSWSGGLNKTSQGVMEFVEMFKAPIKMLHPMLTATQEGHYNGTEQFGAIPFHGILLAHSNESEWTAFRQNPNNEAFLDRVYIVKVPYCLRINEEVDIYKKLISHSELANKPCAPGTLDMMAQFSVLSRLKDAENSSLFTKMEVYNGQVLKDKDPKAKPIEEYREAAGVDEGMNGSSTRFAYKVLSQVFNYDSNEVAANPVHLLYVLEQAIKHEQMDPEQEKLWISFIKGILAPKYAEFLGDEIQKAYLESYSEFGQNLFDRYITYADAWIQEQDYRDPDTGEMFDRGELNEELEKIEKPAGIGNPKDFRSEVVNFVLRAKANNNGKAPKWNTYAKLADVIEKKMFANTEELLPVISFGKKGSEEEQKKHNAFVQRMVDNGGYTERQVRLLVDWHLRYKKHH